MSRISLVQPESMTEAQQAQYHRFPANLTRALLRTRASTAAYLSLGASFTQGSLSARDRELVILRVGALSQSAYERMQHLPIARSVGWTDAEIAAIEAGRQQAFDARTATLLRFVDECVHRVRVSDATLADLKDFLTEEEIAEATLLVGHYMMTARFLETLGVELDDEPTSWSGLVS